MNYHILPNQTYNIQYCEYNNNIAFNSYSINQFSYKQINEYVAFTINEKVSFLGPLVKKYCHIFVVGFTATRNLHQYFYYIIYNGIAKNNIHIVFNICNTINIVVKEGFGKDSK